MTKKIPVSLSLNYVSHWGVWEALRELLQNAIDTHDYEVNILDDNTLEIISRGGKIPTKALLLGNSGKREDDETIGTYGEGLKLALVVLLREGMKVRIENGEDLWEPVFEYSSVYEDDSLVVNISDNVIDDQDCVRVLIEGLHYSQIEEMENNFLDISKLSPESIAAESPRGLALYKDLDEDIYDLDRSDSKVFVNGLFVGNIAGKYFYDYSFKPECLTLDRDRNTVPRWEFQYETTRLLAASNHPSEIARLSISEFDDVANYTESTGNYYTSGISKDKSSAVTQFATDGFIERYGENAFPINDNWSSGKKILVSQKATAAGKVPVPVSNALYEMIGKNYPVDDSLQELLKFDPINYLSGLLERYGASMTEELRDELEDTITTLKIAKGN